MTLYRTFSKQQIAKIFAVNRSTVYAWEVRGCPVHQPGRHGRPAKMDFEAVLTWFLEDEDIRGTTEKGLEVLEQVIRERKAKYYG